MARFDSFNRSADQAHTLRQLVSGRGTPEVVGSSTHVIAVTSGKGGVGKTLVAVNLAIALAGRGHRVLLLDMDMGLANADIVLGVEPTCTWSDVVSGRRSLDEVVIQAPGDIDFIPGASGVSRVANLSEFERHQLSAAMQRISCRYDVVVMDCGAGISQNVITMAAGADIVLVVATPEPTSITDAYATIKTFAQYARVGITPSDPTGSLGLIVNSAASRREGKQTFERLAGVAARFLHLAIMDYGYILQDEHVPAAVREQCPVLLRYPRCSASSCLMAAAGRLSREMGQPAEQRSLFYRVMSLFI